MTVNESVTEFPAASVAVQNTVVTAIAKVAPDAGAHVTSGDAVTASVADAVKLTTRPAAELASSVMSPGMVSWGAIVSSTVTVNPPLEELPAASDVVQVTVVTPIANVVPDAGVHVTTG